MGDMRKLNRRYKRIANTLIANEPDLKYIAESAVRIGYLSSEAEKTSNGRIIFGQCEKVPEKWKWAVPYDFVITVFEPNVERFTRKQIRILILHELLHVGIEYDGNEEKYYVIPHDVEDFKVILERYGMDWNI